MPDQVDRGRRVVGEQVEQQTPPAVAVVEGGELRRGRLLEVRRVGEPPHLAARRDRVAEERPAAEDHGEHARLGVDGHAADVAAGVQDGYVARARCGRVEPGPGDRVQAVGADQQVAGGRGPVGEPGGDRPVAVLDVRQPMPVREPHPGALGLLVQGPVEIGPLDRLAGSAVGGRSPVGQPAENLAGPVAEHHPRRGEGRCPRPPRRPRGPRARRDRCRPGSGSSRRRRPGVGYASKTVASCPALRSAMPTAGPAIPAPMISACMSILPFVSFDRTK